MATSRKRQPRRSGSGKSKRKRTHRELESQVSALEERLERIEGSFDVLARSQKVIFDNQKELSASEELLDEQFAVSTRMSIMGINFLSRRMEVIATILGSALGGEWQEAIQTEGSWDESIDADDIEKLFLDWATFRRRSDFRDHMTEWMLGVPLDKMPPEQTAKKEGDDDGESDSGDEGPGEGSSGSAHDQENEVPQVR